MDSVTRKSNALIGARLILFEDLLKSKALKPKVHDDESCRFNQISQRGFASTGTWPGGSFHRMRETNST